MVLPSTNGVELLAGRINRRDTGGGEIVVSDHILGAAMGLPAWSFTAVVIEAVFFCNSWDCSLLFLYSNLRSLIYH